MLPLVVDATSGGSGKFDDDDDDGYNNGHEYSNMPVAMATRPKYCADQLAHPLPHTIPLDELSSPPSRQLHALFSCREW